MPSLPSLPSVPRLPFIPDPLRRARLPKDLDAATTIGAEDAPEAGGLTDDDVAAIWKAGLDLYRSGVHPALQLCVRRNGRVVLDRAIGHARGNGPGERDDSHRVVATPETPFCIYSSSKAVTAMVVHLLDERGLLDIEDAVAEYVPEYACNGKEDTTIAHVLAHRAGVSSLPREAMDLDRLIDREFLTKVICDAKAASKPGTLLAYHAVSGGFVLAEIVARVTGKDIRQVLAEEILEPLRFRWMSYGVAEEDLPLVGLSYPTGPRALPPLSTLVTRALGAPMDEVVAFSNDPRFLTAIVPSANIVTSANELSRFFELLRAGGELDGVRVMEPDTISRALTEQSHLEVDWSLVFPTRFSYGLMLGAKRVSLYGRDTQQAFGHLGLINIMGWADPERGVSAALLTSGKPLVYPELARFLGVMSTISARCPKVPESELLF